MYLSIYLSVSLSVCPSKCHWDEVNDPGLRNDMVKVADWTDKEYTILEYSDIVL